ncbi:hypothetical protein [uncultured Mitsuokella sp.]|uniref:hypothetical protein n=1 Tax=uncultured Mitsuokella sp. TaxID=453120 RepID=UPI00261951D2|nr:hypothetical protein [uncultured Mitsuokella sp.]
MNKNMSMEASEILEGLQEALSDAKGMPVKGVKKTIVYRVTSRKVGKILLQDEKNQEN